MRALLISFSCVFVLFSSTCHVSAEITNRLVAFINNDVITLYELEKKIGEMTGKRSNDIKAQDEQQYIEIRQEILEELINEKITQAKIQELGLKITEGEIDSVIEDIKTENRFTQEELIDQLKTEGITYERYREKIKEDLERNQLIDYEVKSKIIVREDQIIKYYQDNMEDYKTEGQVYLAGIYLMKNNPDNEEELAELTKKGEMILARLKKGEDFGVLAEEFSQGPGADEGGDLGLLKSLRSTGICLISLRNCPKGESAILLKETTAYRLLNLSREMEGE